MPAAVYLALPVHKRIRQRREVLVFWQAQTLTIHFKIVMRSAAKRRRALCRPAAPTLRVKKAFLKQRS